ncbi:hypothetical protein, partial [Klebsiella pneumoniae]|uniref:hypothetical protein n=1 Tax=Klebsiella pneumoniae TaxID=573 RepID=UPI001952E85F
MHRLFGGVRASKELIGHRKPAPVILDPAKFLVLTSVSLETVTVTTRQNIRVAVNGSGARATNS